MVMSLSRVLWKVHSKAPTVTASMLGTVLAAGEGYTTIRDSTTVNGYYKAELVRGPARPGPWRTVEDLELATLGWVSWHNTQRLHGYLGDVPPAEFEDTFYAVEAGREQLVGIK